MKLYALISAIANWKKVGNEQPKEWTEIKHNPTFNLDYSANIMFEFKNNKKVKAISIKQPWASLIAHGIKDIENRTWKYPQKYIGQRVLIHASSAKGVRTWSNNQDDELRKDRAVYFNCVYDKFPKGVIIGSVVIADCVQNHPSIWAEKGCWNWVLKDAILFDKPIRDVKGKLGFWEYNLEN